MKLQMSICQQVFVICPSTVDFDHRNFVLIKQFYPHLSMEDPPDINTLVHSTQGKAMACSKSSLGNKYNSPTSNKDYCNKEAEQEVGEPAFSGFLTLEHIHLWMKSELSLNLYQLITTAY